MFKQKKMYLPKKRHMDMSAKVAHDITRAIVDWPVPTVSFASASRDGGGEKSTHTPLVDFTGSR